MIRLERILILVLDSLGMGEMPDAAKFGDEGSDTLGHVAASHPLHIPHLQELGIANIRPLRHLPSMAAPKACFGKATLASNGKDTTSGHWEMMGLILETPFPTYPNGFPSSVIRSFEKAIGRKTLANRAISGTEIIQQLGQEHMRTGYPIVYTSADSVFQVAAHEDVLPVGELYRICQLARSQLDGEHEVGRVIARPFVGTPGNFARTERRKDFAIEPFIPTVLDRLEEKRIPVICVGKVASIFCYRGTGREVKSKNNRDATQKVLESMSRLDRGLIFANFNDFDMLYGHRNDVEGYARALEEFDVDLRAILASLRQDDLLILTSDHGCDPATASTDHSREYALLLAYSKGLHGNVNLGTRASLADIGATVAENFAVSSPAGRSFLQNLK